MKRLPLVAAASCMLLASSPTSALARIVELGQTATPVTAPVCPPDTIKNPSKCTIVLTRVTALETIRDSAKYPSTAKQDGSIVAFTVGLSALTSDRNLRRQYIHNLDQQFGNTTHVAVTVLRPIGPHKHFRWQLVAESPFFHVQPYLGEVVQFPLPAALPIARGDVVALTTDSWAPVLSIELSHAKFAYRQSRSGNCDNPPASQQAQVVVGQTTAYKCDYVGTRVEYSATEITTPIPPKNYVHAGDGGGTAAVAARVAGAFDSGGAAITG